MQSREYEIMYIVRPDVGAEVISTSVSRYRDLIQELGGSVANIDEWGMRRMAYEIDDHTDGYYVVMQYAGDEALNKEMDRKLKLDDTIIRSMIVKQED